MAFPQFYFPYDHNEQYQGIYVANTDNEYSYLSRVQEVRDGHPALGGVVYDDGKDDPAIQSSLGEILVAYLGRTFFLDLNNTILLARFIFPVLGFLSIYGFVFLITKEKLTALTASVAVFFAEPLLSRGALSGLLRGEALTGFLDFYRPIHPQVSSVFYFAFLPFFWLFLYPERIPRAIEGRVEGLSRRRLIFGVISVLILGLSFYVYPYTWSLLCAFLGVLFLILIFQKKWPDAKRIFFLGLAAFSIGIFYFINAYAVSLHPYFQEVIVRFRYIATHQPVFGILVPSMLFIFLLFFPKNWKERFVFCLSLLIAPFLVLNQQIITGKEFSSGHYHWFYNQPTAVIFLIIIFFYQLTFWQKKLNLLKRVNLAKLSAFLIIGISFYIGISIQAASYRAVDARILSDQKYGPVAMWLRENSQKDQVFLAEPYQADILSIYTPLNPFYSNHGYLYLAASNQRILDALFLFYRLDGVSGQAAGDVFLQKKERHLISKRVYGTYYKNIAGRADAIPDELLLSFAMNYRDFLEIPLDKIFKKHNIKYAVWDKKSHPQWRLDQYQFLNKAYEDGDFAIFRINK